MIFQSKLIIGQLSDSGDLINFDNLAPFPFSIKVYMYPGHQLSYWKLDLENFDY